MNERDLNCGIKKLYLHGFKLQITPQCKRGTRTILHSIINSSKRELVLLGSFHDLPCIPQRSNAARVRNMNRFNGGKLPGNSKHFFKTSKDIAVPGKRSFKRWVSVETFLFVYLWLYRLVLCFVTVFPAKRSYELRSLNALNWYRFSRHWQPDVT